MGGEWISWQMHALDFTVCMHIRLSVSVSLAIGETSLLSRLLYGYDCVQSNNVFMFIYSLQFGSCHIVTRNG